MIKIAVASEGKMVTEHFGHCENFNIFDVENGKIIKSVSIPMECYRLAGHKETKQTPPFSMYLQI